MKRILSLAIIFGMAINMFAAPAAAAQNKTQRKQSGGIDLFALKDTNQEGALTMDEAVALAMKDNTTIQVARKNAEIYAQQVRQYWSSVYPQIVASGSYTRALRGQEIITSMGSFKMSLDNAASASLEGTLVLWKGGAVRAGIRAAELASQSGYLQLEETQNQIKDVVTTLCFGIILSHALIQVQQENLNIAKDHLKEITSKYKQGLASDLDVLNQKVKVSNSEPPLIQALNSYDLGLLTLRRVLNKDPQDPLSLTWQLQDVLKIKVPGLEELYKMAEENRPELVIADLNVKAEEYEPSENVDRIYFFNPFSLEILQKVMPKLINSYYASPREMLLFFYYPSDEYMCYLMTLDELDFYDELDLDDLFDTNDARERIMIFRLGEY